MGIQVKALRTIKRDNLYIAPGTVFEYENRADADYAIARGIVSPYLEAPILPLPEYTVTDTGVKVETPAFVPGSDRPPESFTEEPLGLPAVPEPSKDARESRDANRNKRR